MNPGIPNITIPITTGCVCSCPDPTIQVILSMAFGAILLKLGEKVYNLISWARVLGWI